MKKPSSEERADASAWLPFKRCFLNRFNSHICLSAIHLARKGQVGVGVKMALDYFKRSPDSGKAIGGELILATTSWVYGKAGLRDKSIKTLKKAAARIDRAKNMQGGDKALALAALAETLSVLQHR